MRLITLLMGLGVMCFLGVSPAFAATDLVAATLPSKHEQLSSAPGYVTVAFNNRIAESDAKLVVKNSAGKVVTMNELLIEETNISIQLLPNLPKDTYTVEYQVRTAGQLAGGAYQFSYGPGKWTQLDKPSWVGASSQPSSMASTNEYGESTATSGSPSTTATASAQPTTTQPTSTVGSETPSVDVSASNSPGATPATAPVGGAGALWIAAVVVLAAAGVGVWLFTRRRTASRGRRVAPGTRATTGSDSAGDGSSNDSTGDGSSNDSPDNNDAP